MARSNTTLEVEKLLTGLPNETRDSIMVGVRRMQELGMTNEIPQYLAQWGVEPKRQTGILRALGLTARNVIEGVGNLAAMPFALPTAINRGLDRAIGLPSPEVAGPLTQSQGPAMADALGLPRPETRDERLAGAAGQAMASALPFMGGASTVPQALMGMTSAGLGGGATQAAAEGGAGPLGQFAAGMAASLSPAAAAGGPGLFRRLVAGGEAERAIARQNLATMEAAGVANPSLGVVAARRGVEAPSPGVAQTVQGGIRNIPGAGSRLAANAEAQASGMGARARELADDLSPLGTPEAAGRAIETGFREGFVPRFRATADRLYERFAARVPADQLVPTQNTVQTLNEMVTPTKGFSNLNAMTSSTEAHKIYQGLLEDMLAPAQIQAAGGITMSAPFGSLMALRSRVGRMLSGQDPLVDKVPRADLKRIYGALSEDLAAAAKAAGPQALKDWNRANAFWRAGRQRMDDILDPLVARQTPEQVFNAVLAGGRDGGTVIRTAMRSLDPEQQAVVSSTVLRRMGMAPAGAQDVAGDVFSPATFLTRWNNLSPEAKSALFGRYGAAFRRDVDNLAAASSLVKTAAGALPNPSGTAQNTAFFETMRALASLTAGGAGVAFATGQGMSGAAASTIGGVGLANLTARAFTSPTFVRWAIRQNSLPPSALPGQVAVLGTMARQAKDPQDRETALEAYQALVETAGLDPSIPTAADATAVRTRPR